MKSVQIRVRSVLLDAPKRTRACPSIFSAIIATSRFIYWHHLRHSPSCSWKRLEKLSRDVSTRSSAMSTSAPLSILTCLISLLRGYPPFVRSLSLRGQHPLQRHVFYLKEKDPSVAKIIREWISMPSVCREVPARFHTGKSFLRLLAVDSLPERLHLSLILKGQFSLLVRQGPLQAQKHCG